VVTRRPMPRGEHSRYEDRTADRVAASKGFPGQKADYEERQKGRDLKAAAARRRKRGSSNGQ